SVSLSRDGTSTTTHRCESGSNGHGTSGTSPRRESRATAASACSRICCCSLRRSALCACIFFFSSRRRHTRFSRDWSSDVCSSDLTVFLARDRFGIQPLFYAMRDGDLVFGSEAKALFASGEVDAAMDPHGLDEVFTFWGAHAPRTPFRSVNQLPAAHCATWRDGELRVREYYTLDYDSPRHEPADALEQLDELMRTSVGLRMRADVPVGGYLSGGLDSSITCSLAAKYTPHDLRTFSVTFADPALDESDFQKELAGDLGSVHAVTHIDGHAIAEVFPTVVRHAETPLVRTAPAPLYLLSKLTREQGIRVVL